MKRTKVSDELQRLGAVLIRTKKHDVWRLPDGRRFVVAQSPSDARSEANTLADLRRVTRGAQCQTS